MHAVLAYNVGMTETPKKFTREWFIGVASKGGKARAAKLTAKQRSELASKAAKRRWVKRDNQSLADAAAAIRQQENHENK